MNTTVLVVTVTYGDRAAMCVQTVRSALEHGATRALVVVNGATESALRDICEFADSSQVVTVLNLGKNGGSAEGFGAGIEWAVRSNSDYIWLLDDDNWICSGHALSAVRVIESRSDRCRDSFVACFRRSDGRHRAVFDGTPVGRAYPRPGTFMGFDLATRLPMAVKPFLPGTSSKWVEVPQAPYGGLFAHRESFSRHPGPRRDFVLYFDDVQFTRSLTASGSRIFLLEDIQIDDAGKKWATDSSRSYLQSMIDSEQAVRTYYSVRNSFVVDRQAARKAHQKVRFLTNWMIYSAYVVFRSAMSGRSGMKFIEAYARATLDALHGRMGERMPL